MLVADEVEFYIRDCEIKESIAGQELYERIGPLLGKTSLANLLIAAYSDYAGEGFGGMLPKEVETLNEGFEGKVSAEEIIEWSKQHMAAYKYPRQIEFRKQFSMTSSGKILWRTLQEEEKTKISNRVQ